MNKKRIGILFCILFSIMFLINITPSLATNHLFNNKEYDFHLDDFYDSDNLTKTYTGAEFQTENFDETDWSGTIDSDDVALMNNTKTQYGNPNHIDMIKGTTDSADNMEVNDLLFTTFTSSFYSSGTTAYISPQQWADFDFDGESGAVGELETNDGDYAIIDARIYGTTGETYLGYIVPESDYTYTEWNEGDAVPHWSKLDEAPGDMDGDGGNIRETTSGEKDRWRFTTLVVPAGKVITKIVVWYYVIKQFNAQTTRLCSVDSMTGYEYDYIYPPSIINYSWVGSSHRDLLNTQADLDALSVSAYPSYAFGLSGWIDIEAVYIDIYYSSVRYNFNYEITWDVDLVSSIDTFYYDYRTTLAMRCRLYVYNWDTTMWLILEDNTDINWHTDSYDLTDPYISATNQVRIRFLGGWTLTDYDMELDQITLECANIVETREIEMAISFPSTKDDDILAMSVSSWQRTNISQIINFSTYNHDTGAYVQISRSSDILFTEKEYTIIEPEEFISSTGVVRLHWAGVNVTNDFELHIDYLFIRTYHKIDLVHSKSFDTNGIYRYRWVVLGLIYNTPWVEFEVMDFPDYPESIFDEFIFIWVIVVTTILFLYILYALYNLIMKEYKRKKRREYNQYKRMGVMQQLIADEKKKRKRRRRSSF